MMLERLSNSVYARIHPYKEPVVPADSNRGYIVCNEFVVLVDTTYFLNNLSKELRDLKKITKFKVEYIVNTHYHSDHSLGNGLFNCEVVAHSESLRLMRENRTRQFAEALSEIRDPPSRRQLARLAPGYPTIVFEDSYRLDSDPSIEVIHLGGHTPDLSAVYVPSEKILFASDDVFGSQAPSIPSHPYMMAQSDLEIWLAALSRIIDMDVKAIIPGHFGVCNKQAVRKFVEYLELFMRKIRELKQDGYSKEEVKSRPDLLELPKFKCETWIQSNIEAQFDNL